MKRISDVARMGFGAMQLTGPGIFGPNADPEECARVLRRALELGVDHIDTSDYYGPHVVNDLIRETLAPYSEDLVLVTKVGARRDEKGNWLPDFAPEAIERAVHDNLARLGVEHIGVNLRLMGDGDFDAQLAVLARLADQGLVSDIGISTATPAQVRHARDLAPIACVQNEYNIANRGDDDLVEELAGAGVAYVPYFPLGGFSPLDLTVLDEVAASYDATGRQVALAWLLQRSPNILLIPGTSSVAHLEQNIAARDLTLTADDVARLDAIGG